MNTEPLVAETERQQAERDALYAQPGERISTIAHLGFSLVLFLTTIILIAVSHSYGISKNLDFVKIYGYNKSNPVKGDALDIIKKNITEAKYNWVNEAVDYGCRDMVNFWWPTVSFTGGTPSQPLNVANCDFRVNLKLGPMEDQLQVKDITVVTLTGCIAGTYPMIFNVPSGNAGTISMISGSTPTVIVAVVGSNKTITVGNPDTIIGYNFKTMNVKFKECLDLRQQLASSMLESTSCTNGFSSPLCTCVRAFASRITSWQSRLGAATWANKPSEKKVLGDVLRDGVARCIDLRRSHDIRKAEDKTYARSSALIVFVVALVFNAVFNVLNAYGVFSGVLWYAIFFAIYFVVIPFASLADNNESGLSQSVTVLAMVIPALVHGGYCLWLHAYARLSSNTHELPYLHPVTFDICLCALTLFTLVERGVVQTEYLVAETIKCHVVGAVYIAIVWFHCHGKNREALDTEFVQQAYLILFVVGLLASVSSLVTPYAVTECFQLHWLLPGAFTYVAFVNPGWSVHLRMAAKLNNPSSSMVYNFNSVAGFLFLLIGGIFLSSFLAEYFQIYGARKFSWPTRGDPLSYAAVRGLILPLPTSTVPKINF
jgi:hypothetical protein